MVSLVRVINFERRSGSGYGYQKYRFERVSTAHIKYKDVDEIARHFESRLTIIEFGTIDQYFRIIFDKLFSGQYAAIYYKAFFTECKTVF